MRDADLGWPRGTTAILDEVFRLGLARSDGWQVSCEGQEEAAFALAARIYKRGVEVQFVGKPKAEQTIVNGRYDIEVARQMVIDMTSVTMASPNFYVVDRQLANAWPHLQGLDPAYFFSPSEPAKNLGSVARMIEAWKNKGSHARWVIFGGGITGDVAGFAAALCGAEFEFHPTTLLAMVDACVGGKTGVNYPPFGKNQVGLFAFPAHVTVNPSWLESLRSEDFKAGLSECWKHVFLSGDADLFNAMQGVRTFEDISLEMLAALVRIKAQVVEKDPYELNLRATLNFGHTLAHALESVSHAHAPASPLSHGQAVAVGMVFAAELSVINSGLSRAACDQIIGALLDAGCLINQTSLETRLGVPVRDVWPQLLQAFSQDKKASAGQTRWVLLRDIGDPDPGENGSYGLVVPDETLLPCWQRTQDLLVRA